MGLFARVPNLARIVERETAEADFEAARQLAQAPLAYVTDNITDPLYDLRRPRGHATIRTTPAIIRAMTTAQGELGGRRVATPSAL